MNNLIKNMAHMQREEALMLMAILVASLVGLLGTAVFLNWTHSFESQGITGIRPFFISVAATLVYCAVMGGVVFLLHPRKGLLKLVASNQ